MRNMVWVLRRTASALKNRAHQLRLHNRYANRKPYTADELRLLRKLFPHVSTFTLAKRLKRSVCSVNGMATKFGLHKSAEYIARLLTAEGQRLRKAGEPHRFPKGHVPANKGLRRPGYSIGRGRMQETQFKEGQRPHDWLPIGTVKMNADGYLRRKIADEPHAGNGANSRNWEFVHKRVWEDAHGPIPKGHRIWWKDKDHTNCALENLELLNDKEHMARTTIHRMPPELKETIQMAGNLKRRIRRIERGEKQNHRSARPSV
jgi:hypothetical protein